MGTVARRCLTFPVYLALAATVPLIVATLPVVALVDLLHKRNWAGTRALAFICVYLLCEAAGIVVASLLWLPFAVSWIDRETYLRANFRLQCRWAGSLFGAAKWLFAIETDVVDGELAARGPMLVFCRHASTGDTVLPAVLVSRPYDIVLRYVLKKELLWDPCLDIVGRRLTNYFVDRRSCDPVREIEEVAALADDLGEREGVLIFPEGTRFSAAKRQRALRDLEERGDVDLLALARSMRNVLPPKLGGPLALLQRNVKADLVLLAHTGFEGVEKITDLFNGSLIGRAVNVRFWRFSRSEIPTDPQALSTWLFEVWKSMDDWISQMRAPCPADAQPVETCPS